MTKTMRRARTTPVFEILLAALFATALAACKPSEPPAESAAAPAAAPEAQAPVGVTAARIIAADAEPQNWLTHGRTYDEQR